MAFFLEDGNVIFSSALALMLMIAVLEGVLTVIGFGMSHVLDGILPDLDINPDIPDGAQLGGLSKFLAWLRIGQVPAIVLLVTFLTCFGVVGISIQLTANSIIGTTLPSILAVIAAFIISLPFIRGVNGVLQKIAIKDETAAMSTSSFVGQVATITLGEATQGSPAEARFTDRFGTTHYVMVQPDSAEVLKQGESVLLVEQNGATFTAILNTNNQLSN